MPIRGIPYLMGRKIGEGPLLLTTALDELREEVPSECGAPEGTARADMLCGEQFASGLPMTGTPKKVTAETPTGQAATACRAPDSFIPVPKTRKQQQPQHQQAEEAPAAPAPLQSPQGSQHPMHAAEQQHEGKQKPKGFSPTDESFQPTKTAPEAELPAAKRQSVTTGAAKATAPGRPLSTDTTPLSKLFRKASSGIPIPKAEPTGTGAVVAAGDPAPVAGAAGGVTAEEEEPLLGVAEGWALPNAETGGGGEKGEMTIAEGARVLLEAYVLYRYIEVHLAAVVLLFFSIKCC